MHIWVKRNSSVLKYHMTVAKDPSIMIPIDRLSSEPAAPRNISMLTPLNSLVTHLNNLVTLLNDLVMRMHMVRGCVPWHFSF